MKVVVDLTKKQIETLKQAIGEENMSGYDFEDAGDIAEAISLLLDIIIL